MSHHNSASSSHSNSSDLAFPFQHEESGAHQTLLPDGILNDEDDVVPWPRKPSKDDGADKGAILRVRRLPQDMTGREFAGLFLMADGYLDSELIIENDSRVGLAKFKSLGDAERTKLKMSSVSAGPYARLSFEVLSKRGAGGSQDIMTPPATLSSSSKSSGSNGSMPQISRLASYVKERSNESQIGLDDFYGTSSSVPKSSVLSGSVPTNFSTSAGATVWSSTSPRFNVDLGKSPPSALTMLPPPTSRDDDSWNRSGTQNSVGSRFSQLNISTSMSSQDARVQHSPTLSPHPGTTPIYASIDDSLRSNGPSRSPYTISNQGSIYHASSPPKHYMASPTGAFGQNGSVYTNHRMGPPTPINTNPADQNPPCNTLYVGNLPLATTEEELKSLFSRQPGYRRLCYRTKSNGPMCFVEFEDVHYAINSLKLLQGVILSSSIKGGIRLSFSKNPLGVRKMDGGHSNGNGGIISPVTPNGAYNAMHAPPGLQSGQTGYGGNTHSHGHNNGHHHQPTVSPIWR